MAQLEKIVSFLETYLGIDDIEDDCWNGLQFEGKPKVEKIILAVDAGQETFTKAAQAKADMIIVHHGQFWRGSNPSLTGWHKKRLKILWDNNISLYAAHLPLDRHEDVGNNVELLRVLEATIVKEFMIENGKNIGWIGRLPKPVIITKIEDKLNTGLPTKCITLPLGPKLVKTIAVCTGGGGYHGFNEAVMAGVDLYITGDTCEIYQTAKDAGINVIFAGHYATETLGLKALIPELKKKFNIEGRFIDIPTGL